MASNITLYVQDNVTGSVQSNSNKIGIEPNSPATDYILIVFTEKQNCNNTFTALFQNTTTNCNVSEINILSADTNDYVNGQINWTKLGLYEADIYYQSSDSNLITDNATFSYTTCLEVTASYSCDSTSFSCEDLDNCDNFNSKLDTVAVDGVTITGDGTPDNPLSSTGSGTAAWGAITGTLSNQTDLQSALDAKLNKNITTDDVVVVTEGNSLIIRYTENIVFPPETIVSEIKISQASIDFLKTSSSGSISGFNIDTTLNSMGFNNGSASSLLKTSATGIEAEDGINELGVVNNADYTPNYSPQSTPNVNVALKYVTPVSATISTATGTIDNTYTNNQTIEYTGSGGNLTIESTYLNVNEVGSVMQIGVNPFTLVAGAGVTLIEPDSLFTSEKQYVSIGIYKQNATTYIINGRTA